ncbi:MAG: hypothetical protein ACKO7W_06505 [Elainella sp.]
MSHPTTTTGKLAQLIRQLPEADRVRLLQFGEAMLVQKSGKRRQRSQQRERPVIEDWRVGG